MALTNENRAPVDLLRHYDADEMAAHKRFLADRKPHLAPRSIQTEGERVKPINKSLGDVVVCRMTAAQVGAYIRERNAAGRSNATINRELDIIREVLKRSKRWHHFAEEITRCLCARASGKRRPIRRR
jgi:hypothetical protein